MALTSLIRALITDMVCSFEIYADIWNAFPTHCGANQKAVPKIGRILIRIRKRLLKKQKLLYLAKNSGFVSKTYYAWCSIAHEYCIIRSQHSVMEICTPCYVEDWWHQPQIYRSQHKVLEHNMLAVLILPVS